MNNSASSNQKRATTDEIYFKLVEIVDLEAKNIVFQVEALVDLGENMAALAVLKEYDATIGGIGIFSSPDNRKLPGIYRAISYVQLPFHHKDIKNQTRSMVHAACVYLEELLKKIVRTWPWEKINPARLTLGMLVKRSEKYLPQPLVDRLNWVNSNVYVFAKHHYNFEEDEQEPEHYFSVGEAVAVYLIVRKLGLEMEKLSGKSFEELQYG